MTTYKLTATITLMAKDIDDAMSKIGNHFLDPDNDDYQFMAPTDIDISVVKPPDLGINVSEEVTTDEHIG